MFNLGDVVRHKCGFTGTVVEFDHSGPDTYVWILDTKTGDRAFLKKRDCVCTYLCTAR